MKFQVLSNSIKVWDKKYLSVIVKKKKKKKRIPFFSPYGHPHLVDPLFVFRSCLLLAGPRAEMLSTNFIHKNLGLSSHAANIAVSVSIVLFGSND